MKCIDKVCIDRVLNGGDAAGDFYFCKCVGVEVGRGEEECLLDKWCKLYGLPNNSTPIKEKL